ncbi:hypothetical protein MAQ5080_00567 [Marinomonas aquimarina]|uniref:VOC domain-containing protein n=1 Tax=Marinomonas aquimarina TaxID=295068 RepID=A0A1A8T6B3_9GAMM|nr:hypothetical protein [Marinomonas aquimarina]SBS26608.1 hypothetical protein MAQ5080_00567 [Marinomonas aquimarina]
MIQRFDQVVLTVADAIRSQAFYKTVFEMTPLPAEEGIGVAFGEEKILFQQIGDELRHHALEGAGHLSLISELSAEQLIMHFEQLQVELLEGPIDKGAYVAFVMYDLDRNLIQVKSTKTAA